MNEIKSTNGIWKSRYEHDEEYGDTYWSHGRVNIVDGRVYLDSTSLEQCFARLEGHVVGFEFVEGLAWLKDYGNFDPKIEPLVNALQKLGIRTLNSCEGHLKERFNYLIRYPYVDFPRVDVTKLPLKSVESGPVVWTIADAPFGDASVVRLRTKAEAENERQLADLHHAALELSERLSEV